MYLEQYEQYCQTCVKFCYSFDFVDTTIVLLEQEIAMAQTQTSLTTTTPASNILTHKSSNYGFIVHYRDGWQKVEFSRGIGDGTRNTVVNFLSPLEDVQTYSANIL
jgi:hypothetical protein